MHGYDTVHDLFGRGAREGGFPPQAWNGVAVNERVGQLPSFTHGAIPVSYTHLTLPTKA